MVLAPSIPTLILQLPIIVSIVAATRYFIGFKTWKNYPTLALVLAFFLISQATENVLAATGYWLLFTTLVLASAIGVRYLLRRLKINYYARIALMYLAATVVALIALALFSNSGAANTVTQASFALAVFLIGTTIDEFATLLFKKDFQEFLRRLVPTLALALISGLLVTWNWWNSFLGRHHEILVLVLAVDFAAAVWTSIRVTEIIRFGSIVKSPK